MNSLSFVLPLIIASMLDWLIGDPWDWLHPVQVMGWVVAWAKSLMLKYLANELAQRIAGVLLAIGLIMGSYGIAWALIFAASRVNPWFGLVAESIMIASCLAHRSLQDAAVSVLEPIEKDDLDLARKKLALYVGRDTEQLDRPEILRAVLETVAENCTDGVIAPLIFAIVGGAPLALAYKAASTLDSMIGYKEKPYTYIGWFSAKLEDALTWLPCRLLVLAIALLSGRPVQIWRLCQRDAPQDPSPNAGWSECAFAAALGVQLGGKNTYRGLVKTKPLLGEPDRQITIAVINETLGLMQQCFVLFLGLGVLSHTLVSFSGLLLGLIQHG
nr:adenosylcobinamide-phosphate synthase CbiB [Pseudanabaena sp. PCC 7367]